MDSITIRKRVQDGGIFVPLSEEWNNREVEVAVTVRDVTETKSVDLQIAARQFFSRVTVRTTESFDEYDQ